MEVRRCGLDMEVWLACNGFEVGVAGYVHGVDGSRTGASVLE